MKEVMGFNALNKRYSGFCRVVDRARQQLSFPAHVRVFPTLSLTVSGMCDQPCDLLDRKPEAP